MFRWGIHKPPSAQSCLRSEPSILTLHHLASNMLFSCKAFSSLQGDDKQFCLLVFKPYENWFRIITSCYITLYNVIYTYIPCCFMLHYLVSCYIPQTPTNSASYFRKLQLGSPRSLASAVALLLLGFRAALGGWLQGNRGPLNPVDVPSN